ncbi:cyclase [Amycolatopsis sp. NBRC 101858]|uniref:cyclase family protein n=1 Tax=Amycolatopsis sp. NBRC 101858 TaxID=3032200 RepID=UPI0024A37B5D|nr:cyclase family protein [Amycolatopsis sp. NBRC 101858]GLY38930.1 cyclase [Amycolatopsis sp. NBRC 101858]
MSTQRWKQRPPGSNWGEFGDDDELGRINLLTKHKVLEGIAEVQEGRTFGLSLPLDLPGGSSSNQRRYPPVVQPTEDLKHNPASFYNMIAREFIHPGFNDVWSDDQVTLWMQYSTQWDALAHQGAEFDADADGVPEAVYYNGYRAHVDIVGPVEDARGDGSGSTSVARHLGMEHMAAHGVQGRGVLIDLSRHLGTANQPVNLATLQDIMNRDGIVVEPGDMVLLHTGTDKQLLEWNGRPDPATVNQIGPYLDGYDPAVLQWITDSQLSALISDNSAVEGVGMARPAPDAENPGTLLPIHHHCLFKLGVPLGELWLLQDLADWLHEHERSRFLLTAPPLRLPGTQGSPLTPVATV